MPRPHDPEQAFAASVTSLREGRSWSQDHLASLMRAEGIADASQLIVSRIETGRRKVALSEALALARIFNLAIPVLADVGDGARWATLLAGREANISAATRGFEQAVADYLRDGVRAAQMQVAEGTAMLTKLESDETADPEVLDRIRKSITDARYRLSANSATAVASRVEELAVRDDGLVMAHPSRQVGVDNGEPEATP